MLKSKQNDEMDTSSTASSTSSSLPCPLSSCSRCFRSYKTSRLSKHFRKNHPGHRFLLCIRCESFAARKLLTMANHLRHCPCDDLDYDCIYFSHTKPKRSRDFHFSVLYHCFLCDSSWCTVDDFTAHVKECHQTNLSNVLGDSESPPTLNDTQSSSNHNGGSSSICAVDEFTAPTKSGQASFIKDKSLMLPSESSAPSHNGTSSLTSAVHESSLTEKTLQIPSAKDKSVSSYRTRSSSKHKRSSSTRAIDESSSPAQNVQSSSVKDDNSFEITPVASPSSHSNSNAKHPCPECGKLFTRKRNIKRHMLRHREDRAHVQSSMVKDDYSFEITPVASSHSVSDAKHPCLVCGKLFTRKRSIKRHMLIHKDERDHVCDFCPYKARRPEDIVIHIKTVHRNHRPFTCDVCSKSFCFLTNLKRHQTVHTKEKPYQCDICSDKLFGHKGDLNKHMRNFHPFSWAKSQRDGLRDYT